MVTNRHESKCMPQSDGVLARSHSVISFFASSLLQRSFLEARQMRTAFQKLDAAVKLNNCGAATDTVFEVEVPYNVRTSWLLPEQSLLMWRYLRR